MIEREVLNYQAPLYGRRTGSCRLAPLELPAAALLFPDFTPIQQIETWAVLGGMPYYLGLFTDQADVLANVRRHILDDQGVLHREPQLLLMEELHEPRNYFSVLRAIAHGKTRLNEIRQTAGVGDASTTARYLDVLQGLHVVNRSVPVTEGQPEKSKKGLYQITDSFLRFWFRFVHPYQALLDLKLADAVLEQRVRPMFDGFVGHAFEEAARDHVAALARTAALPFLPERIGRWWDRQNEVDLLAISDSERAMMIGECKWWTAPVGVNILAELKLKADLVDPAGRWPDRSYALFSKSGYTADLRRVASAEGVLLVEPRQMVARPPR
jgi:AAA+ ATPase superfamily predicted ATPase